MTGSSEAIMFIAALVAAGALAAGMIGVSMELQDGLEGRAASASASLQEDIRIVNDPANVPDSPLTLYVKNTGSATLVVADFFVLLDGEASTDWDGTIAGSAADRVLAGQTITITVNDLTVAAGDHRASVSTGAGARDYLQFST